eukprot:CAMPEP_0168353056 /NCGR_PEP_ID=MMETSP0213-20121227/22995_1 /TAXON_ID=151035 /ORGANISM="Euplotes harpa, Strain FSP1.4" /LENGTH=43 /DNA_ID= /DNA_START= /DNA_END= /DNA_ORIENTATION=
MNLEEDMKQTTQGVWLGADTNNKVLVFDVEGSDSLERDSEGKG